MPEDEIRDIISMDENEYLKSNDYFLGVEDLCMYFPAKKDKLGRPVSWIHAVDDVTFHVPKGKTLGVVGESGCGKSTLGKVLVDLYSPTKGRVVYDGVDLTSLSKKQRKPYIQKMQMIWQDPYSSLDPRMHAGDIIAEPIRNFGLAPSEEAVQARVKELLELCGLYEEDAEKFPHQFSGGQRQRICIARALAADPEFIVCDEAVSALDVSIQAQIINLLKDLQEKFSLTYLFISHDLNIVQFISDEIIVMYLGEVVERGTREAVYEKRAHPYTRALFSATPEFPPPEEKRKRELMEGELMSPVDPKPGCRFANRCPHATERCRTETPVWNRIGENHLVRCWLYEGNEIQE